MNKFLKKKGIGFYLLVLSGILAIIATARYADWAPANYVMNPLILAVLIIGIVLDLLLVLYDNDYLVVQLLPVTVLPCFSYWQIM